MSMQSVMVIEDDEGFQHYMKSLLRRKAPEIEVIQAFDGVEALKFLDGIGVGMLRVIFLDLNMCGMNGFEFLEEWQKNHSNENIKIIVLTSSDEPADKEKVRSYSFVSDYVVKPLFETDVARLIAA